MSRRAAQRRRTIQLTLSAFLVVAVLLSVAWWLTMAHFRQRHVQAVLDTEDYELVQTEGWLEGRVTDTITDALALAYQTAFVLGSHAGVDATRELEGFYLALARANRGLSQVRFIDLRGREVVRVDTSPTGEPHVLAPEALQDKSDRPFVQAGLATAADVWVSKFDLNVEHGRVALPHEPTLRVVVPLRSEGHGVVGLVVLNLRGEDLLDRATLPSESSGDVHMIVDSEGTWLVGPLGEVIIPGENTPPDAISFAGQYPDAWRGLQGSDHGQVSTDGGALVFRSVEVHPPRSAPGRPLTVEAAERWRVLSMVPPASLVLPWALGSFVGLLLVLALVGLTCWRWAEARTSRSVALRALQDNELMKRMMDSLSDGVILADSHGVIQYWSSVAGAIFGYEASEVLGRQVHELLAQPEVRDHADVRLAAFAATGHGERIGRLQDLTAVRKDGSTFTAEVGLSSSTFNGHRWTVGTVRDVTERKILEAEVHRHRDELEDLVASRTAELVHAQQEADAANRAKSAFLANMSHEIRTPINAIVGMTSLAQDTELTSRQHQYVRTIEASSRALLALVDDILDFSKIEAGRFELDPVPFSLSATLDELATTFRASVISSRVELSVIVAHGIPDALYGDAFRLCQVLSNLLSNAFKFTERGEIIARVGLAERSGPGEPGVAWLRFTVADTGIGIAREKQDTLFQPFVQATGSTVRLYGGTGLGLAICRRIVELMGGAIGVRSELGAGAEFWFEVPFGRVEEQAPARAPLANTAGRALLVVHAAGTRDLLREHLHALEIPGIFEHTAEEALASLDRQGPGAPAPGFVVVDLTLPGMDGLSFARTLRRRPAFARIPVVLLSAFAGPAEEAEAEALNAAPILLKPLGGAALAEALVGAARGVAPTSVAQRRREPDHALGGWHVLVAEDNQANRLVVSEMLHAHGATTDFAVTGLEALEKVMVDGRRYSVVLMDIQMPVMDGLTAIRRIREALPDLALPLVALTANAVEGDREACLAAGADAYLSKPIDRQSLVRTVARLGRPVGEAAQRPGAEDDGQVELDGARRRLGLSLNAFNRILGSFLHAEPLELDRLAEAIAAGDRELVGQLAQSLASAAANVGATSMEAAARSLEAAAREQGAPLHEAMVRLGRVSSETFARLRDGLA